MPSAKRARDGARPPIRLLRNLSSKLAAIPMVLVGLGVFVGGTIWTVVHSFTDSRLLPRLNWVGLDHKIRFENTFRTIFLYPFALSFIVTGLIWQWVLNPEFGIQSIVRDMGFPNFNFDPLYNPDLVIIGLLIAGLWQGTGLIMVIMLAGLRGIDEDIWKATRVDGIPVWKTYIVVIIPMMKPVFVTALVLVTSGIVKLYDLVVAMTAGGPGISSEVPAKFVYDTLFTRQNLGQGFAASTMMLVTVAIILIPWAYMQYREKRQ